MTSKAPTKAAYRVRHGKKYDAALVRRGSLTLWVEKATLQAWRSQGPTQRGAQFQDSDTAIECRLTLRAVYRLTLRATAGLAGALLDLRSLDRDVPDHTTLSRRAGTVPITLPKRATGPLHRVRDSTGLEGRRRGRGEGPPARLLPAADRAEAPPGP